MFHSHISVGTHHQDDGVLFLHSVGTHHQDAGPQAACSFPVSVGKVRQDRGKRVLDITNLLISIQLDNSLLIASSFFVAGRSRA